MYINNRINRHHLLTERTSAFTSRGSITMEATISSAIFFFGVLCLVNLFEIQFTQIKVRNALHAVAKEVALDMCTEVQIPTDKMENEIVKIIGENFLNRSLVVDGVGGFDCSNSKKYWNTTILDLSVCYQLEIPIFMFRIPIIPKEEIVRVKGWTGYEEKMGGTLEEQIVYVTEYGIVYHKDMKCTFLELSLRTVTKDEAAQCRNQSGGKYKECTACKKCAKDTNKVYVTDYGEKYHYSLECNKINRRIYTVPLSKTGGLGGCSKCVK